MRYGAAVEEVGDLFRSCNLGGRRGIVRMVVSSFIVSCDGVKQRHTWRRAPVQFSAQSARRLLRYGRRCRWRAFFTSRRFVGVGYEKRPWRWRGSGADSASSRGGVLIKLSVQISMQSARRLLSYDRRRRWREIFTSRRFVGVGDEKRPWRWSGSGADGASSRGGSLSSYGFKFRCNPPVGC